MIKQTLYFGNPAYLSLTNKQLVWKSAENNQDKKLPAFLRQETERTINIEDVGFIILDHSQITLTQRLMSELMECNVVLMTCDPSHHPNGLFVALNGNTLLTERHQTQVTASIPLKKNLWAQIITRKIYNQACSLKLSTGQTDEYRYLAKLSKTVKTGDLTNREAMAASYYWPRLMPELGGFIRMREGFPPNNFFNYAYALLRASVARAIVSTGLIPSLGLHHKNKYNAFCLADDMMEAFRPAVDAEVVKIIRKHGVDRELNIELKKDLLSILTMDVKMEKEKSPLMVACTRSVRSLYNCFEGSTRKLLLPGLIME